MRARCNLSIAGLTYFVAISLAGCGSGSSSPPPPPVISVSVAPGPLTVQANTPAQFIATVSGDSANQGVTWATSCSAAPCGTFNSNATSSGVATTYTAPGTVPANGLPVTITATSAADPTKSAVTTTTDIIGINEAHVDTANGIPRLIINGQPVPPLIFMYQEYRTGPPQYLAPQVKDVAARGIHLYAINLDSWPWDNQGTAPLDFSAADQELDNVIKADPLAAIVLKVSVQPGPGWKPAVPPTTADYILYADGQIFFDTYHESMASDIFFNGFLTSVPHLIQHYENSWYAPHILGYITCAGNTGEWFPVDFWTRSIDYSPVNSKAFEIWLQSKYGTDAALSAAWGRPVTIASAQVPAAQPGRFPIHGIVGSSSAPIEAFYQLPNEQDWVDYSAYISDLTSQRILDAAQLVRTQTGGKRLIGFYNGYLFDLAASFNGHLRGDRLLSSPNIDFLCAPNSYTTIQDRLAGGSGGMMTVADSVVAHGKLWFNENDLNTYLSAASGLPPLTTVNGTPTADLTETVDVLQRDLAAILVHRVGTWWMDLNEDGAFNDPNIWAPMSDYGVPLFNQLYANPQPYHSDVALIVDRTSIFYQKNDYDVFVAQRALLRNVLLKSGVASGAYYLDDFLNGTTPPNKVYIFVNANYLTDVQITGIQSRLNAEGATAIWQYAPGFLGPSGVDVTRSSRLTGIQLSQSDGYGSTNGAGLMAGYSWGFTSQNVLSPRLVVTDTSAEILGLYQSDGQVSSARKKVGNFESIFIGDFAMLSNTNGNWTPDALRAILQTTGVHIWSAGGDVIHTDGNLFVIHAATAGPRSISLPAGVSATPLGGGPVSTGTLNVTFSRVGETLWFHLSQAPQGAPARASTAKH